MSEQKQEQVEGQADVTDKEREQWQARLEEMEELLKQATDETQNIVDLWSIWRDFKQIYRTYDGRLCKYSVRSLAAALGKDFQGADYNDQVRFLAYCISWGLDPLRGQVHFIRYKPGEPPSFVVSWEVYLDRAQRHPQFDGYEDGVVWHVHAAGPEERIRGQVCDYAVDDAHQLVGGWARVHRKDRKIPRYVEVRLEEMETRNREGKPVRAWARMPFTMSLKTPASRALRQSFPETLAGLYTEDESKVMAEVTKGDVPLRTGDTLPAQTLDELAERVAASMTNGRVGDAKDSGPGDDSDEPGASAGEEEADVGGGGRDEAAAAEA